MGTGVLIGIGACAALVIFAGGVVVGFAIRGVLKSEQEFEYGRKFEAERQAREDY